MTDEASTSEPQNGAPPALVVEGLSRRYEDRLAVDRLDFHADRGEILGLLGPNGAGKTTTLRSVAGVLPLEEGRVTISGFDLVRSELESKRRLAWVPDDPAPFEALTIDEHLEFTAGLYAIEDWRPAAEGLLTRFELIERRDALGAELSRGMRQKLAFCQAWLSRPEVVLLDEPLSGLDPRGIRSARAAIRELADAGTAVILSSHLLELVEALADRLLILDRGQKRFEGTLDEARQLLTAGEASVAGGVRSLEDIFLSVTEGDLPEASS